MKTIGSKSSMSECPICKSKVYYYERAFVESEFLIKTTGEVSKKPDTSEVDFLDACFIVCNSCGQTYDELHWMEGDWVEKGFDDVESSIYRIKSLRKEYLKNK